MKIELKMVVLLWMLGSSAGSLQPAGNTQLAGSTQPAANTLLAGSTKLAGNTQPAGFATDVARLLHRVRLPPKRLRVVPRALHDLERTLRAHWLGCEMFVFGSITTGLALGHSDIDVTIVLANDTSSDEELVTETAGFMDRRPGLFRVAKTTIKTRQPIVTLKYEPTAINVDISFKNINGFMNSKLLRYLLNLDERVMDLARIVKYWARLHRVTKRKRFSSYGMITMLVFYLQQKEILPPIAHLQRNSESYFVNDWNMGFAEEWYPTRNNESLCTLLGGFFKYYTDFNFDKYLVSAYAGRPIEIDLFRDFMTIPDEFAMYKINLALNRTRALLRNIPIVQDMFEHDFNLASRLNILPNSEFEKSFRYAAMKFQENCTGYLDAILTDL